MALTSSSWSERNLNRSSIAANSSSASGFTLPSRVRSRSALAARFSWIARSYGTGSGAGRSSASAAAISGAVGGTGRCGPYSPIRVSASRPYSSGGPASSCSIRIRCSARATSSRCTLRGEPFQLGRRAAWPAVRTVGQLGLPADPGLGDRVAVLAGLVPAPGPPGRPRYSAPPTTARATAAPRARAARRASARARASRSAAAWRASASARPASAPTRSSAVRTASRTSISCWRAAGTAEASSITLHSGRIGVDRRRLRVAQPILEVGQAGQVTVAGLLGLEAALRDAVRLGPGRPGRRAELGQPAAGRVALTLGLLAGGGGLRRPPRLAAACCCPYGLDPVPQLGHPGLVAVACSAGPPRPPPGPR